jgi:hypothetical protein
VAEPRLAARFIALSGLDSKQSARSA